MPLAKKKNSFLGAVPQQGVKRLALQNDASCAERRKDVILRATPLHTWNPKKSSAKTAKLNLPLNRRIKNSMKK